MGWNEVFADTQKEVKVFLDQHRLMVGNKIQHPRYYGELPNRTGSAPLDPKDAQKMYGLLIIDDGNPSNAPQHNASKDTMERLLRTIKREIRIPVEVSELKSSVDDDSPEYMSRDNILAWVQNVNADKDDIVFVYFSGDGGTDLNTGELYLSLPTTKLERKQLANAIDSISCRLKILVTDPCNYSVPQIPDPMRSQKTAFADLFLEHQGFLNVAGATEGELIVLGDSKGGLFTYSFIWSILGVDLIERVDVFTDDDFVSWKEIFAAIRKQTQWYFEGAVDTSSLMPQNIRNTLDDIGQTSQRPKHFGEFPKRIER